MEFVQQPVGQLLGNLTSIVWLSIVQQPAAQLKKIVGSEWFAPCDQCAQQGRIAKAKWRFRWMTVTA
jgi:hypothetical protein